MKRLLIFVAGLAAFIAPAAAAQTFTAPPTESYVSPSVLRDADGDGQIVFTSKRGGIARGEAAKLCADYPTKNLYVRVDLPCPTLIVVTPPEPPVVVPPVVQPPVVVSEAPKPGEFAFGVNFSNASNGSGVGTFGKEWSFQPARDFRDVYAKPINGRIARLGFRTTRLMATTTDAAGKVVGAWDQPLIPDIVKRTQANIGLALDEMPNAVVVVEMHDYGRAFGVQYGVAPFDVSWIVSFWREVLGPYVNHPRIAIDFNNEPHLSPVWQQTVTQLVPAMRAAGINNTLVIEGIEYSGARGWVGKNGDWFLKLRETDKNLIASPHFYMDDGSGTTDKCGSGSENWADSFINWSQTNSVPVLIGEFGYSLNSTCKEKMPVIMTKFRAAGFWVAAWGYSFYMPTGKYHFGLARPATQAVEPSNLLRGFAAEGNKAQ